MNDINSSPVSSRARQFSFDTAAMWALILTGALTTLSFTWGNTPFLYTKISILAIGTIVTLALYILGRLTRGNIIVPPVALLGALWIVPIAYGLSSLFSAEGFKTAFFGTALESDTFGFILALSLVATLTALTLRRVAHFATFYRASAVTIGLVLIAQVIFVIASRFAPNFISSTSNIVGSFSDLGMLAGLGITISLLALRFLTVTKRTRIVLFGVLAIGALVLALLNSVLVWILVALVGLGLFIEAILRHRGGSDETDLDGVALLLADTDGERPGTESHSLVAPLAVLVVSLFFVIGSGTIGGALANALGTNVLDVRPSWQSTFDVGGHAYAASPIFGSGPNTFGSQWLQFRDRSLNDTVFWNAAFTSGIGFIPTSFITTGILGALAWLALLGLLLFFGLRALLFRLPTDPFIRFVSVSSFTGTLYVLALMIFTVPGPVVLMSGFVFMGVFVSSLRYAGQAREWGVVFSKNPRIGFVIVFGLTLLLLASIVASYVVVERYLGNLAYAEAATALQSGNLTIADAAINRAVLFAPTDTAYQLAAAIGIAHMNTIANNTTLAASEAQQQFQAALSASINAAVKATQLGPKNYQNWAILGQVYQTVVPLNIDGAYKNASAAFTQAVTLNPTNPILPYTLAQLEIAQKNNKAAEEYLVTAINLKHDYTQAIFLLSQLEVGQGRAKEALQAAEAAAYFAPNDPTVLFQVGILRSANGDNDGAIAALSRAVEANPQYANAHYFLGVMYAIKGDYTKALAELNTISAMSPDNAKAVEADVAALTAGRNPFPPSRLGALGIPQANVTEPTTATQAPAK